MRCSWVGASSDAIDPLCHHHGIRLSTAGQRRLEARPAVVLAGGDVGILRYQRPALYCDEGLDAGLLGLATQPAIPLFGGRDPDGPDRQARCLCPEAHQPASASEPAVLAAAVIR